jgi:Protein of unknown function (DUF2905)
MLYSLITLFVGSLAGMAVVGWFSDRQAQRNEALTPGLSLLPGDIKWENQSGSVKVYFPVVSSIVLSVVLSLVMWLAGKVN